MLFVRFEVYIPYAQIPFNSALLDQLQWHAKRRAKSHGNYLPALDKALELLKVSRQDARLWMVFMSDGAPSDHVIMPCRNRSTL